MRCGFPAKFGWPILPKSENMRSSAVFGLWEEIWLVMTYLFLPAGDMQPGNLAKQPLGVVAYGRRDS
jgi:hypothetical protein